MHPTWDYGVARQKKRKSKSETEKTNGGAARSEGGGLCFAINQIVEILWAQTAPDELLVEFFWDRPSVSLQSWIYRDAAAAAAGKRCGDLDVHPDAPALEFSSLFARIATCSSHL